MVEQISTSDSKSKLLHWLSEFGALPVEQIQILLHSLSASHKIKLLHSLERQQIIIQRDPFMMLKGFEFDKPKAKEILALWLALKYIDQIDPMSVCFGDSLFPVVFLKKSVLFQVAVITSSLDDLLLSNYQERILQQERQGLETRYLFLVYDESWTSQLYALVKELPFEIKLLFLKYDTAVPFYNAPSLHPISLDSLNLGGK